MPTPTSAPNQPDKASKKPHDGWLTRAQVAAELGYRSIFPVRKMEGQQLHPVRTARGWLFDPAEVAALKAKRPLGGAPAAAPEGRVAARVLYLFDHGRELREIVEELEISPALVRDLWHEWLINVCLNGVLGVAPQLDEGLVQRRRSLVCGRRHGASRVPPEGSGEALARVPARLVLELGHELGCRPGRQHVEPEGANRN